MTYIAFARKYRPQVFDDIIGQSHVTTTLKNAISQDRVAHAYLFAGPRGVGKTTAARILAKALNCEKGPSPKPCNACSSCKDITQGSSLDILEIDGASNRGIDEIRNLRDNVKFAPTRGRFKVYIIDEVHMLTSEAFNALLKTLEEPPKHVKFIFATTQAHKVPATILSRCQRFDFRRLAAKDIAESLKAIVKEEGVRIDDEALALIAKYSDGGMRDAQVMLDQMSSFTKGKVGIKDVTKILGVVEDEALFSLSEALKDKDAAKALGTLDTLVNEGKDVIQVSLGLIEHFRNMAITRIAPQADNLIEAGPDKIERYRAAAQAFTIEDILYIVYTLSNAIDLIKKSTLARAPLEAALIKLTLNHSMVPISDIIKRVEDLEKNTPAAFKSPSQTSAPAENSGPAPLKIRSEAARTDANNSSDKPSSKLSDKSMNKSPVATLQADEPDNLPRSPGLEEVLSSWAAIINYITPKKISVASYLQEGSPSAIDGKKLSIEFPKELQFHKEMLETQENKAIIEAAIKSVLGKELSVVLALSEAAKPPRRRSAPSGMGGEDGFDDSDAAEKEVDPILKTAMEIFGGDVSGESSDGKKLK